MSCSRQQCVIMPLGYTVYYIMCRSLVIQCSLVEWSCRLHSGQYLTDHNFCRQYFNQSSDPQSLKVHYLEQFSTHQCVTVFTSTKPLITQLQACIRLCSLHIQCQSTRCMIVHAWAQPRPRFQASEGNANITKMCTILYVCTCLGVTQTKYFYAVAFIWDSESGVQFH